MKEYPTQPGKEGKLKASIVHTVRVKIRHRKFSNNAVPDLNENISGSTDLVQKWHGSADLRTPIHPPPKAESPYVTDWVKSICDNI